MNTENVTFTYQQLQWLESLYPQVVMGPGHDENQMRHYFGQQSVMRSIRDKTRGLKPHNPRHANPNDIPTTG